LAVVAEVLAELNVKKSKMEIEEYFFLEEELILKACVIN